MSVKIDKNATIGSILNAIREGNKAEDVAKEIDGISQKPLLKALKEAGYAYSNKAPKGWHYIGEGTEPKEKSIFDYVYNSTGVKRDSSKVNNSSHEVIESNTRVKEDNANITRISPVVHPQFTQDELIDLVEMLQEWRLKKATEHLGIVQEPKEVHARIKILPQGDKTRKTIVIDKGIGERLDNYCKAERVNKSDVLHLALMDFLDNN